MRFTSLDHSSALDSVILSLGLHSLERFGCPKSSLARLSDYITNLTQRKRMDGKISIPLLANSGILQRARLSARLFSSYISSLLFSFPLTMLTMPPTLEPFRQKITFKNLQ